MYSTWRVRHFWSALLPKTLVHARMLFSVLLVAVTTTVSPNECVTNVGVWLNNTEYADGSGPRTALNASDCCDQCTSAQNCQYWAFQIDSDKYPGVTDCKWAHLTYCCYFHTENDSAVANSKGWTSGSFTGIKPGPPPPPAQCNTYKTKAVCPERCTWTDGKGCASPPPPPPPPGPCAPATQAECGVGTGPYTGAHVYCANACAWNGTKCIDRSPTGYPIPDNSSLVSLVGVGTPLSKNTTISFYGDSITWLDLYEGVIAQALKIGAGTHGLTVNLIDQGINGGTVTDLVRGWSQWGHLDPHQPQTNITFAQTLARDKPDIVAVQIGVNDVWQQPAHGENSSVYAQVLRDEIVKVALASGAKVYLASISVIGEEIDATNHAELQEFADAMKGVAQETGVPYVDLLSRYLAYETANNCLNSHGGILTGAGVHPYTPQGKMMLANAHSQGIIAALKL
eukprot:m.180465 g.180465  ORF g.180465 m.180465 type:complete len:455 (-) comp24561_c0_seq4:235-1599(-)